MGAAVTCVAMPCSRWIGIAGEDDLPPILGNPANRNLAVRLSPTIGPSPQAMLLRAQASASREAAAPARYLHGQAFKKLRRAFGGSPREAAIVWR